jgi:hypothetical protein
MTNNNPATTSQIALPFNTHKDAAKPVNNEVAVI